MAVSVLTFIVSLMVLFGESAALPQNKPAKFVFETQNVLIQTCLKNSGSSTAYKRITMALDEAGACFSENTASSNSSTDSTGLEQNRGCPLREQDRTCLNPIIDPVLSCLTGSRKQNRVFLDKLADEIIDIKCTINQNKHSSETENPPNNRKLCVRDKLSSIIDCDAPFFGKSIILSDYDARECAQLSRSKSCIMDILSTCGNSVVAMVDKLYNVAGDVNNCNEDIGSSIENEI